ncbi:MAG: DegT/DnrJ/EryC1/StrS family aminotransferase [Candidatus Cloacimonetes bacterium]|nr:DegT/DnrJ/EryC1/StrS family aminotransferase [Candidatus Cloacimonadota bacterium]
MQFIDLKTQQLKIRTDIIKRIEKILDHGKYVMGPEVQELEQRLADYSGTNYAIGVSSGTDALMMTLMAYDIGKDDAVFTTPFTFIATASMIRVVHATPVFVDIHSSTFNIDCIKLEQEILKTINEGKLKPKAIIAVDLFGQLADYDKLEKIAKKYNLILIEDAAQSFGASYKNKKSCSFGDIATTSFFPAKPLGGYGDSGMIFTNGEDIYKKLLSLRVHGKSDHKYNNIRIGINGRLDTIQAAIILAKMEIFDEEIQKRQKIAVNYTNLLPDNLTTPKLGKDHISAWAQYSILSNKRDKLMQKLNDAGIPTAIYYPKPLHLQDAFNDLNYNEGDFPVSEDISEKIFSLPFHPYLKYEDQVKIAKIIGVE